jgi:hypothetical protein
VVQVALGHVGDRSKLRLGRVYDRRAHSLGVRYRSCRIAARSYWIDLELDAAAQAEVRARSRPRRLDIRQTLGAMPSGFPVGRRTSTRLRPRKG